MYEPSTNQCVLLCRYLVSSTWFQWLSITVILLNAISLGIGTYPDAVATGGFALAWVDTAALTFFTLEVIIGLIAFGRRPWHYFKHGWNVFDFIVVVAALTPGMRENATLLRLLRLARILKLFQAFPSLRVVVMGAARSIPKSIGLIALTIVIVYLWGMLGCILFGQTYPERFGTIDRAALHLFQLMVLDDVGNVMRAGIEVSILTIPYYLTFIFIGAFILFNILIGVVLASMEEARKSGHPSDPGHEDSPTPVSPEPIAPEEGRAIPQSDSQSRFAGISTLDQTTALVEQAPADSSQMALLLERTAQLHETVEALRAELAAQREPNDIVRETN
ncbi:ion transporter [Natronoglycomyces albus]|uniref:Ion transporter n=1 Tax=Natronoglycomyces albus TaxID=2811108 RepID=A0A895XKS8_9ACTN|nr:ion transporter [Natronoglycomyces albus]QSB04412.1 ion transporter [Natronoglycomyces albus]